MQHFSAAPESYDALAAHLAGITCAHEVAMAVALLKSLSPNRVALAAGGEYDATDPRVRTMILGAFCALTSRFKSIKAQSRPAQARLKDKFKTG